MSDNDLMEDVEEVVEKAKESALSNPIVKAFVIVITVVSMGGFAALKTWQQEIVDMVCETEIEAAINKKEANFAKVMTIQSMHYNTCDKVRVCYETGALMMGISTEHCKAVEKMSREESEDLIRDLKLTTDRIENTDN
jgi:hypothetical protein